MTYTDSLLTRLYIPQPFASSPSAAYTAIEEASSDNNPNFVDGFPSVYSAPASGNGKYVTRGTMNAIGRLASQNEFCRAMGQIVTFNQKLAYKHGGYPKYAVLDYLNGLNYYHVISLKDNNMVDFTGSTALYDGITSGSVDGVNWAYCERGIVDETKVDTTQTIADVPNYQFSDGTTFAPDVNVIGYITPSSNGYVSFSGSMTRTDTTTSTYHGFFIIGVSNPSSGGPTQQQGTPIYYSGNISYSNTSTNISYPAGAIKYMTLNAGTTYGFFLLGFGCTISDSSLKVLFKQ